MTDHESWPNRLVVADPAPVRRSFTGDAGVELSACCWDGPGTNVLLVHGLASNALLWQGVGAELAAAGFNVAAVDLRGHGRSGKPDSGYDYGTVSRDVALVIESWASAAPVHIAGQSWGGNVVLRVARDRPDLIAGVVAVDGGRIACVAANPAHGPVAERGRLTALFQAIDAGAPLPANAIEGVCAWCEMRGLCRRDHWDLAEPARG